MSAQVTTIQPTHGWRALHLRELWDRNELLFFFIWRDITVRYKQTLLGVTWAVINPLVNILIYTIIFSKLARFPSEGIPYPVFFYAAMLPWAFFSGGVTRAGGSLIGNANLLSKVYFPRLHIPLSAVLAGLVDFAIGLGVLFGMLVMFEVAPTWRLCALPLLMLALLIAALSFGLWVASFSVRYRDAQHLVPFLLQILMFASPIVYSPTMVYHPTVKLLYNFNPLVALIQGFRWSLAGGLPPSTLSIVASVVSIAIVLVTGLYYFTRLETTFADIV